MLLLLLEALGALLLMGVIVWWTMFSGRDKGELMPAQELAQEPSPTQTPEVLKACITEQVRQLDR
jgi:hypothetical protein